MQTNLKVGELARQGDIALRRLADFTNIIPSSTCKSVVLALGEKTGHAHTLSLDDPTTGDIELVELNGVLFLRTSGPSTLRHQEHGEIGFAPGSYQVHKQREQAQGDAYRQVID